jgi:predicted ribosomally synthesized peptide with nif11-like leader
MPPAVEQFIEQVKADDDLQQKVKRALKAEELAELAGEVGITFTPAELVKSFAHLLLESDDDRAVALFDNLGWDAGELLWALKGWGP